MISNKPCLEHFRERSYLHIFVKRIYARIFFNGQSAKIQSPHSARALNIGMVFQDFSLIPALSVMENLALFLPRLSIVLDVKGINRRIQSVSDEYGLDVNPAAIVSQLSIGELQKVEILKLLLADARV